MLHCLQIDNFALIEHAELEFCSGFNVITGESGAGKSILMGALRLLLGGRADRDCIRGGCDRAVISGIFSHPDDASLREILAGAAIPCTGETLEIRRVIAKSFSRCFINDTPCGAVLLSEVGSHLADMHGADDELSLTVPERQLELLDLYGHTDRGECRRLAGELAVLKIEQEEFDASAPGENELEELEYTVKTIGDVDPQPGEDADLESRCALSGKARRIIELCSACTAVLDGGENSIEDLCAVLFRRLSELRGEAGDERCSAMLSACDNLHETAESLLRQLEALASGVELDPAELERLEARLDAIYTLKRRFGPALEDVLARRDAAADRLASARVSGEKRAELDRRKTELTSSLVRAASVLTSARRAAAADFAALTVKKLGAVGFNSCRLIPLFSAAEPGANGADCFEWNFSANAGEEPHQLRRTASSGELSRVMLGFRTVLAAADGTPTVVFDEIDSNIGGETAVNVAAELHALGACHQIICISHLAQVAVRADRHFAVAKHASGGRTVSESSVITGDARISELARMLGGGEAALRHAGALCREYSSGK